MFKYFRSLLPLLVLFLATCGGGSQTSTETYSLGGTLTGLAAGNSITLTNNGTDRLTLSANGAFSFPTKQASATAYKLTLSATTPTAQACTSSNGEGTINATNVSTIKVTCEMNVEAAGLVQFVKGEVQQTSLAGQNRAIHKGDAVNEGDTLSSSPYALAKIKMRDGGLITMRSDTQFKIDTYTFNGKSDGSEQLFFSIIKGGFRSVTGLIGKLNKKGYRIGTPWAVLGIRGTDHEILFVAPGSNLAKLSPAGTYDKVNSGATTLANEKGMIVILPKQMGYVSAPDQKPKLQPVNPKLFTVDAEISNPFDGRWSVKLVCDDTKDKTGLVKGYTWKFDVIVDNGKLEGQYGLAGSPSSGTFVGQVQRDGTANIEAHGYTGKADYTVGRVARGTPFSFPMKGNFSGSTGHATRTKLRPCEASFEKQ